MRRKKVASKDIAKERLKSVLQEDRTNITNAAMDAMRADLIKVMQSYVNVQEDKLVFSLIRGTGDTQTMLHLDAPITSIKIEKCRETEEEKGA